MFKDGEFVIIYDMIVNCMIDIDLELLVVVKNLMFVELCKFDVGSFFVL